MELSCTPYNHGSTGRCSLPSPSLWVFPTYLPGRPSSDRYPSPLHVLDRHRTADSTRRPRPATTGGILRRFSAMCLFFSGVNAYVDNYRGQKHI